MDSFEIDDVKMEKASAMRKYRRIQQIGSFFRIFEICLVLFFLSWLSIRLPIAVRISGDFFRHLSGVLVSPSFVFLVGNVIVITLVAKSGQLSGQNSTGSSSGTDLYNEFMKNSENRHKIRTETLPPVTNPPEEEIVYQDKAVCIESKYRDTDEVKNTVPNTYKCKEETPAKRFYRRTQSEKLEAVKRRETGRVLRRSDTELCREAEKSNEKPRKSSDCAADMSNEEFQRTIEEFIAKQWRFQREESMGIVLQNEC